MYETYIPGFTGELLGGTPGTVSVTGTQSLPTAQPVQSTAYTDGTQSLPTAQPVEAAPYTLDLGNWSYLDVAGLQNLFNPQPAATPSAMDQYIAQQAALGNEVVSMNPYQNSGLDAINYNIWNAYNQFDPNNPGATTGQVFRFDTGNDIGVPDGNGGFTYRNSGQVTFQPGQTYTMTDKTGEVIGTASTPEEMAKLVQQSGDVSYYDLARTTNPYSSTDLGGMMPSKTDAGSLGSMLVNMAALAAPAAGGALLGPVLAGTLGTSAAVGTGLGTAVGSALAGTAAGKSIEDILWQSALAGVTAGGLSALSTPSMPNIGDLQTSVLDGTMSLAQATSALQQAGATASQLAQFAADVGAIGSSAFPTVIGNVGSALGGLGSAAGSAIGGVTGGLTGAITGSSGSSYDPQTNTNTVTGQQTTQPPASSGTTVGGFTGAITGASGSSYDPQTNTNTVTGQQTAEPTSPPPGGYISGYDPINNVITAVGETPQSVTDAENQIGVGVPPITSVDIPPLAGTELPNNGLSTMDYIRLASLGIRTLGSLFGGSGSGNNMYPGGPGSLNPVFSAQLPGANIPGLTAGTTGARAPSQSGLNTQQDWYRYGYGPEQSFFNSVPLQQPNTSQAYTGYEPNTVQRLRQQLGLPPQGFAEGGSTGYGYGEGGDSRYVEGPGDGRDDQIPAMLSDGEYVIDAETVALLGNGSNKAGADLLDKFRVNVRKHKGQRLAKGEISADAKRPEHYMAGGRM